MEEDKGFELSLKSIVKDKMTDYQGAVIAQCEYIYGCRRYVVQPRELHEGKIVDALSFDEDALELVQFEKNTDERPWLYTLGSNAKDKITGLEGILTSRTRWIYARNRYVLQPAVVKDGKPVDGVAFDEERIEVITVAEAPVMKRAGGPREGADPATTR